MTLRRLVQALLVWSAALGLMAPGSVAAQDARSVIADASKAMGVDTLKSVEYTATGFDFVLGQAYNPARRGRSSSTRATRAAVDFRTPASKVDRVRMQGENPPRGGGQQPVIGEQPQSQTIIVRRHDTVGAAARDLDAAARLHPRGDSQQRDARSTDGRRQAIPRADVHGPEQGQGERLLNDQHLVERVETWIDNAYLGDMLFEAVYSDYRDFNGVKFPMKIVQRQGGYPIFDLTVADVKLNAAVTIQPPQGAAAAAPAGAARQAERRAALCPPRRSPTASS